MITLRNLNLEHDYQLCLDLWSQNKQDSVPMDFLTNFGKVAVYEDKPAALMFLFPVVGSKSCLLRFPISNKELPNSIRGKAVSLVIDSLHQMAKEMGYKYILCTTNNKNLIKRLKQFNYVESSTECSHMTGVV